MQLKGSLWDGDEALLEVKEFIVAPCLDMMTGLSEPRPHWFIVTNSDLKQKGKTLSLLVRLSSIVPNCGPLWMWVMIRKIR